MTSTLTRPAGGIGDPTNYPGVTRALVAATDGYTVLPTGLLYRGAGIVVALPEYAADTIGCGDGSFRTQTIMEWVRRVAPAVTATSLRPRAFGVWTDRYGDAYLDVVEIYPSDDRDAAIAAGRARGQLAIWDACRQVEIVLVDDEPDAWGPSADQERAWDAREDDARGHALEDYGLTHPTWDDGMATPPYIIANGY